MICFENVSYSYPGRKEYALENINLSAAQGEFLAVMGENGSGKTTLCKLVNGIIPHLTGGRLTGTVTIDGECTDESSVARLALKAGMVLDDPDAQLFTSTVRHEAAFAAENMLLPHDEIEDRAAWALAAAGLTGFEDRAPSTLSGGEKQRLSIAAALAMKGKILVLDEPLCRLDPQGAQELMSVLKEIKEKFRITLVMADHNSARIVEFADRVCILKNGRIAACDTAKNIFANRALLEENGIEPPSAEIDVFSAFPRKTQALGEPGGENTPAIQIKNFCFSYGKNSPSVENVNLTIADNDFAAIIGKNGCGKTTLLKNITGLLRPCAGDIFIRGRNAKGLSVSDISKEAGFVMQNPDSQLFTDSVFKEAAFALKNARFSKTEIKRRVMDALDTVGLDDIDAFPFALSRADRVKTVIACVLAMGCKIIILDEVDVGHDYKGSRHIMNIARDLHSKGFTIIFVTHNMTLAHEFAHRLIMMDRTGIIFDGRRDFKK